MQRVTKDNPCPICEKPDWCLVSEDGSVAICQRVSEGGKKVGDAGWLHRLTGNPVQARKYRPRPKEQQQPAPDFFKLVEKYRQSETGLAWLSKDLGVSVASLVQLQVGFDGKGWLFPMRDGYNKIVGIRVRMKNKKFAVKGSKNALFRPVRVKAESDNMLFICEGPTDTAALLDLGFDAIGRASCNTGAEHIKTMTGQFNRTIVIMADTDAPTTLPGGRVCYPGIEGGLRLAKELKGCTQSIRVIKPPNYKDIRLWYRNGATKAMVLALVENSRFA